MNGKCNKICIVVIRIQNMLYRQKTISRILLISTKYAEKPDTSKVYSLKDLIKFASEVVHGILIATQLLLCTVPENVAVIFNLIASVLISRKFQQEAPSILPSLLGFMNSLLEP